MIKCRSPGNAHYRSGSPQPDTLVPAEVTDPVHVASVTKSMVAVSVLKLVEEGVIQLQDPVGKHLPEFRHPDEPLGPFTVEHLPRHESGMPTYHNAQMDSRQLQALTQPTTAEEDLALAATLPWVLPPGDRMLYSNSNYVALGLMVQRLRGQPLAQVLHGYITIAGERQDVTYMGGLIGNAAGGLVATVGDLNTFYAALMGGRLLKPATVKEMLVAPEDYGLGLQRWGDACEGGFYYGHVGDTAGYGTIALTTPDASRQVAITLAYPPTALNLTPYVPSNELAWEVLRIGRKAFDSSC
ncbi:UNVERIFIED_ORG: D-alanyl-D-alanine carboxypeptidase [Arthrobacter sp. UYCu721]